MRKSRLRNAKMHPISQRGSLMFSICEKKIKIEENVGSRALPGLIFV